MGDYDHIGKSMIALYRLAMFGAVAFWIFVAGAIVGIVWAVIWAINHLRVV